MSALAAALAPLLPGWAVAHHPGEVRARLTAPDGQRYVTEAAPLYLVAGLHPEGCGPHDVRYPEQAISLAELRRLSGQHLPLVGYTVHHSGGSIHGVVSEESDEGSTGAVEYEVRWRTVDGARYQGRRRRDMQGTRHVEQMQ